MEPTLGAAALQSAPAILSSLFGGGGGGPKPQTVWWRYGGGENLGVGDENITSQDAGYYAAAAALSTELHQKYGAEKLRMVPTFSIETAPGPAPFGLLDEVRARIESMLGGSAPAAAPIAQADVANVSQFSHASPAQQSRVAPGIVSNALEAVSSPFVIFGALIVLAFAVYSFSRR